LRPRCISRSAPSRSVGIWVKSTLRASGADNSPSSHSHYPRGWMFSDVNVPMCSPPSPAVQALTKRTPLCTKL